MNDSYTLHYADGSNSRYGISVDAALFQIAEKYGVDVFDLVTLESDEDRPRILIWTSEAASFSDAGEKAVAELIR